MFTRATIFTTYVLPAVSMVIIALLIALGRTVHHIFNVLVAVYVGGFFAYFIGRALWTFRKKMMEVREYLRSVRSGALERLDSTDIAKLIERDSDYLKELTALQKKQLRSLLLLVLAILIVFTLYATVLGRVISLAVQGIENQFLRAFTESLAYLGVLFGLYMLFLRLFKVSPRTVMEIPYTPMKSLVIYKDAIILDDVYLLRAPIIAKNVVINEYRRYIEIELDDEYSKKVQLRKIRLYVRDPRELWTQVLSKIVQVRK